MANDTPFEGGGFIPAPRGTEDEQQRARLAVCAIADRITDANVEAASDVLQALGLIPYRGAA